MVERGDVSEGRRVEPREVRCAGEKRSNADTSVLARDSRNRPPRWLPTGGGTWAGGGGGALCARIISILGFIHHKGCFG